MNHLLIHIYSEIVMYVPYNGVDCKITCTFSKAARARMFLKGIKLLIADGQSCPTRQCRFLAYEDLPLYCSDPPDPPPCMVLHNLIDG